MFGFEKEPCVSLYIIHYSSWYMIGKANQIGKKKKSYSSGCILTIDILRQMGRHCDLSQADQNRDLLPMNWKTRPQLVDSIQVKTWCK